MFKYFVAFKEILLLYSISTAFSLGRVYNSSSNLPSLSICDKSLRSPGKEKKEGGWGGGLKGGGE
jgi:hypothetical protein